MLARVLLCLDPPALDRRLRDALDDSDVLVERVRGQRAHRWSQAMRRSGDVVVISRGLLPDPAARRIRDLLDSPEGPAVVVLTEEDDPGDRAALLAAGAERVLPLDLADARLRDILGTVVAHRREVSAEKLRIAHPGGDPRLSDFVSASPAMQAFMEVVHRVVDGDSSLLLLGETGVGKERLARAIHAEGRRAAGPFVAVNCGALPESLLESELFGHEKGAFTGASRNRRGWFELAHGGTIFLDEVSEIPPHVQVKLLRVLQEREFRPLGAERSIRVDVRIMAATNRDLEEEVRLRTFRRDLYYRLSVVTLVMPPLRERREDVDDLVASYVEHHARTIGREVVGLEPAALEALRRYDWPGNVRELVNVIERAVLLAEESLIGLDDLPGVIRDAAGPAPVAPSAGVGLPPDWLDLPLRELRERVVARTERAYLAGLLARTGGRVGETAALAGIGPRALHEKMRRLGLRKEDYREGGDRGGRSGGD